MAVMEQDPMLKKRQLPIPSPNMKGLLPSLTLLVYTPSQTSILFVDLEVSWIR